jgi:hypothetical protein
VIDFGGDAGQGIEFSMGQPVVLQCVPYASLQRAHRVVCVVSTRGDDIATGVNDSRARGQASGSEPLPLFLERRTSTRGQGHPDLAEGREAIHRQHPEATLQKRVCSGSTFG